MCAIANGLLPKDTIVSVTGDDGLYSFNGNYDKEKLAKFAKEYFNLTMKIEGETTFDNWEDGVILPAYCGFRVVVVKHQGNFRFFKIPSNPARMSMTLNLPDCTEEKTTGVLSNWVDCFELHQGVLYCGKNQEIYDAINEAMEPVKDWAAKLRSLVVAAPLRSSHTVLPRRVNLCVCTPTNVYPDEEIKTSTSLEAPTAAIRSESKKKRRGSRSRSASRKRKAGNVVSEAQPIASPIPPPAPRVSFVKEVVPTRESIAKMAAGLPMRKINGREQVDFGKIIAERSKTQPGQEQALIATAAGFKTKPSTGFVTPHVPGIFLLRHNTNDGSAGISTGCVFRLGAKDKYLRVASHIFAGGTVKDFIWMENSKEGYVHEIKPDSTYRNDSDPYGVYFKLSGEAKDASCFVVQIGMRDMVWFVDPARDNQVVKINIKNTKKMSRDISWIHIYDAFSMGGQSGGEGTSGAPVCVDSQLYFQECSAKSHNDSIAVRVPSFNLRPWDMETKVVVNYDLFEQHTPTMMRMKEGVCYEITAPPGYRREKVLDKDGLPIITFSGNGFVTYLHRTVKDCDNCYGTAAEVEVPPATHKGDELKYLCMKCNYVWTLSVESPWPLGCHACWLDGNGLSNEHTYVLNSLGRWVQRMLPEFDTQESEVVYFKCSTCEDVVKRTDQEGWPDQCRACFLSGVQSLPDDFYILTSQGQWMKRCETDDYSHINHAGFKLAPEEGVKKEQFYFANNYQDTTMTDESVQHSDDDSSRPYGDPRDDFEIFVPSGEEEETFDRQETYYPTAGRGRGGRGGPQIDVRNKRGVDAQRRDDQRFRKLDGRVKSLNSRVTRMYAMVKRLAKETGFEVVERKPPSKKKYFPTMLVRKSAVRKPKEKIDEKQLMEVLKGNVPFDSKLGKLYELLYHVGHGSVDRPIAPKLSPGTGQLPYMKVRLKINTQFNVSPAGGNQTALLMVIPTPYSRYPLAVVWYTQGSSITNFPSCAVNGMSNLDFPQAVSASNGYGSVDFAGVGLATVAGYVNQNVGGSASLTDDLVKFQFLGGSIDIQQSVPYSGSCISGSAGVEEIPDLVDRNNWTDYNGVEGGGRMRENEYGQLPFATLNTTYMNNVPFQTFIQQIRATSFVGPINNHYHLPVSRTFPEQMFGVIGTNITQNGNDSITNDCYPVGNPQVALRQGQGCYFHQNPSQTATNIVTVQGYYDYAVEVNDTNPIIRAAAGDADINSNKDVARFMGGHSGFGEDSTDAFETAIDKQLNWYAGKKPSDQPIIDAAADLKQNWTGPSTNQTQFFHVSPKEASGQSAAMMFPQPSLTDSSKEEQGKDGFWGGIKDFVTELPWADIGEGALMALAAL